MCTWSDGNAAKMEWYLAGVNTVSVVSEMNTTTIVLPIEGTSGLDGTRFRCRVTTFDGEVVESTVILTVTGELFSAYTLRNFIAVFFRGHLLIVNFAC